jgi:hypothetical protein
VLAYPSGMTMSSRALNLLSDLLRGRRSERGTRWRKLPAGRQALLVVAHLRKNEAYAKLACGFGIGTSTVYRYGMATGPIVASTSITVAGPPLADERTTTQALLQWHRATLMLDRLGPQSWR